MLLVNAKPRGIWKRGTAPRTSYSPASDPQSGRERYNTDAKDAELATYRDRELANCERQLASGDAAALVALLEYWHSQQNLQKVAAAYKSYLKNGDDSRELAVASGSLYMLYAEGQPGLPADPDAAFHYLGQAVKYDPAAYELPYSNALYMRGLYTDAFSSYLSIMDGTAATVNLSKSDRCEINLKLADLYFRGRGVKENWYVGYYYWLQGLSMAADPHGAPVTSRPITTMLAMLMSQNVKRRLTTG